MVSMTWTQAASLLLMSTSAMCAASSLDGVVVVICT